MSSNARVTTQNLLKIVDIGCTSAKLWSWRETSKREDDDLHFVIRYLVHIESTFSSLQVSGN